MITILIFIIIGLLIGFFISYSENEDWLISLVFVFVGTVIGFFIGLFVSIILPMETYEKEYSYKIESLQDNNNTNGNFFLGCGQVNGKMIYSLYYEEEGFYKLKQLDYNLVKIKYSENQPKITVFEKVLTNNIINYFAVDFDINSKRYIIEVPKGTIKNNYTLDTE